MYLNHTLFEWLLTQRQEDQFLPVASISQWKELLGKRSADWETPFERAVVFGFMADRVAFAFIAGFRAALQHLIPALSPERFAAFCVTEEGGNHPRAIKTRLEPGSDQDCGWVLNGKKSFITGAQEADVIFVAASAGVDEGGKNRIKLVMLERQLPGIEIQPLPPLPFIPEIKHGTVVFNKVAMADSDLLPGDGYTRYVKPFRIIEEVYVLASLLGYLLRLTFHYSLSHSLAERLLALMVLAQGIAESDLQSAQTHILFAGFRQQFERLLADCQPDLDRLPANVREEWLRDCAILNIAEQARVKRLANAWSHYTRKHAVPSTGVDAK